MNCKFCGDIFNPEVDNRRGERAKYCSDECVDNVLKNRSSTHYIKSKTCNNCGKDIPNRGIKAGANPKYCSKYCRKLGHKEYHSLYDSTQSQLSRRLKNSSKYKS